MAIVKLRDTHNGHIIQHDSVLMNNEDMVNRYLKLLTQGNKPC